MPSEIEYKFIGDYIEELSKTENPSSADKTLVSNETDGPRYVPANPEALTNVATEADMTADAKLRVMTPAGEKQLAANLVAKASEQAALTTYAQNVAHSIAPEFVPNETTTVAGMPYIYNGILYTAKVSGYQGAWDSDKFEQRNVDNKDFCNVSTLTGSAPFNDLNSFPKNDKTYYVLTNYANVSNKPANAPFVVRCMGWESVGTALQILYNDLKDVYVRANYAGTWGSWIKLGNVPNCIKIGGLIASAIAPYDDLNTFPTNEVVTLIADAPNVAHRPSQNQFSVMTFGGLDSTKTQIAMTDANKMYMRCSWGGTTWTDWAEIKDVPAGVTIKGTISSLTSTSPYNDLNTFPINEICFCPSNYSGVDHVPENNGFTVVTMSGQSGTSIQMFASSSKKIYVRSSWGNSWGSWVDIKDWSENCVKNKGVITSATAPYNDLNTFPINEVAIAIASYSAIDHKPTNESFNVLTFGGTNGGKCQIASTNTKKMYMRSCWAGTWSEWVEIKKYNSSDFEQVNPILYFDNIVCIGDSLTYSQVYTGESTSRQAKKTWPQMLAKLCGVTQTTYAVAGDTAITSWTRYKDELVEKDNALAIIYLGTNKGFTDTLSTDAPENADPSTWSDTNTGCLAKYCNKLNTLGYKIVLIKPWKTGGGADLATTKEVIDQVGTRFGCCVVESFRTLEDKYHKWPNLEGLNSLHYNDLGYSWFASCLCEKIAESSTLANILP